MANWYVTFRVIVEADSDAHAIGLAKAAIDAESEPSPFESPVHVDVMRVP